MDFNSSIEEILEESCWFDPLSGFGPSSTSKCNADPVRVCLLLYAATSGTLDLFRSSLYWSLFSVSVTFNLLEECIHYFRFRFLSWHQAIYVIQAIVRFPLRDCVIFNGGFAGCFYPIFDERSLLLGFAFHFGDPWISLLIHVLFRFDLFQCKVIFRNLWIIL